MFYINYYYSVDTPENRNLEQNNPLDLRQNLIPWLPTELSKRHEKGIIISSGGLLPVIKNGRLRIHV